MAQAASIATNELATRLSGEAGLPFTVGAIAQRQNMTLEPVTPAQVVTRNVAADVAERVLGAKYPAFYIYCDSVKNTLIEKFRTFSGSATMCVDVRVSNDRVEDVAGQLQLYVDAVTEVLDNSRGNWPNGMFYAGNYEVTFSPLKHGGKNFLQSAKVKFDVNISTD